MGKKQQAARPKDEGDRHKRTSFPLRMPPKVRQFLEEKARREFRDLTKEILLALKAHVEANGGHWQDD